jgi:large subunit ribosomal protein L19e
MTLATIRRLAADILGVGERKVKMDPTRVKEVDKALTRADVKNLIKSKVISKAPIRGRRKKVAKKRRGPGSKKGAMGARAAHKEMWMAKVRAQRNLLKQLMVDGALPKEHKRKIYGRIKSGLFKSKRAFLTYLKEADYIPKDYEPKKKERTPKKEKKAAPKTKEAEKQAAKPKTKEADKS